jgi:hypothetical protein
MFFALKFGMTINQNVISSKYNLVEVCMELSQTSENLYGAVITAYGVISTLFIGIPDFNPYNNQFTSIGFWLYRKIVEDTIFKTAISTKDYFSLIYRCA